MHMMQNDDYDEPDSTVQDIIDLTEDDFSKNE